METQKKLGQLLVERGVITGEQLIRAIQSQRALGGRIGTCLLEMDVLSEDRLLEALAHQLLVPAARVEQLRQIDPEVLELVPARVAVRCQAIPFADSDHELQVATLHVHNLAVLDELAFCCNRRIVPHIANEVRIAEALEKYYGHECTPRFGHLLDRLNRSRYMWDESAKILLGEAAPMEWHGIEVLEAEWVDQHRLMRPAASRSQRAATGGAAPANGKSAPQARVVAPPPRPQPPPARPAAPPSRTQAPPTRPEAAPPTGAQAPPSRPEAAPTSVNGAAARPHTAPTSIQAPPTRTQTPPARTQTLPTRAQAPPTRTQTPPTRAQTPPVRPQAAPARTQAPQRPAQTPPIGAQATPRGAGKASAPRQSVGLKLTDLDRLLAAEPDRQRIGEIVLRFLGQYFTRAALFRASQGTVRGWLARGAQFDTWQFQALELSLEEPSLFQDLEQGSNLYIGSMPPLPAHRRLAKVWGGELPRDCLLIPLRIRDRMVAVLYGDCGTQDLGEIDIEALRQLAQKAAKALERCILQKKLNQS